MESVSLVAVIHDLFGDILRNLGIGVGLHYVLTAALCLGTHVGSVTEHLGKRHLRDNALYTVVSLHALDHTAAAVEVADNVAEVLLRKPS